MTVVREERRLVTCMFVDVVGSTELLHALGAERLKRELGAAFAEIAGIITAHGGTVEKYVGDAIYAIFGAPVAHEDDPIRALRAAHAIREWARQGSQRFAVRVGIETGEAVIDMVATENARQQMSVGPVVNLAARLQQRAEPGEVLVGPIARGATEESAELESLGDVDLKGIGRTSAWRLISIGLPQIRTLPFVGREAEMSLLDLAFQRAAKARSVLALVSGPPGQGKTRLVQEFLRSHEDACRVITARCRPPEEVGVFAPVREILGVTTLDALAEMVGRMCTDDVECQRVVAGLAESAGIATTRSLNALPAGEREDEIVQAWRRYIGILGDERLVVVAVDDIHWADPFLVRLVDRLTLGGPRVLVVATARPEFAQSAGIRPSGDRFFIELEGLEHEDAKRLAAYVGRDDDRVIERADGNPLFLVELARAKADGAELPVTLQGALGARLDQLSVSDRTLLSLAAVAGERFTAADAAFLGGCDATEAGRALTRLVDLHFLGLSEVGYRFHHGLVRDVAYSRLLTAERMRAHARFARERVHPEDAETLAHHWWEALRPPDAEWVWADLPDLPRMRREGFRALLAAGHAHATHFAIETASTLLERALGLAASDVERAQAERSLGEAYRRILRQDESWEHLTTALAFYRAAGDIPTDMYCELLETALFAGAFRRIPTEDEIARIADEGVTLARDRGDLRCVARILRGHAGYIANRYNDERERAVPLVDAAIEAAQACDDREILRAALLMRASMRASIEGEPADASTLADLEPRTGDVLDRMIYLRMKANHELMRGETDAALRTARDAADLSAPMGPHNRTHGWAAFTGISTARGDWDAVVDGGTQIAKLLRENAEVSYCAAGPTIVREGAIAHALAGRRDDALTLLRAIPPHGDFERALIEMLPRALLGFRFGEADASLRRKPWAWWEWEQAALRAIVLARPDDAEEALAKMGPVIHNSVAYRAFSEAVREATRELRGGPRATYAALERLGLRGWIEILNRRVDAEY